MGLGQILYRIEHGAGAVSGDAENLAAAYRASERRSDAWERRSAYWERLAGKKTEADCCPLISIGLHEARCPLLLKAPVPPKGP